MAFPFEGSSLLDRGPAGALEGNYVTWNLVWTHIFAFSPSDHIALKIDNNGLCNCQNDNNQLVWVTLAGVETQAANYHWVPWWTAFRDFHYYSSVLHRYHIAYEIFNQHILRVYSNGVLLWQRDTTVDFPASGGIIQTSISPDGHYIGCILIDAAHVNWDRMILYAGA